MVGSGRAALAILAGFQLVGCDAGGRPRIGLATNLEFAHAAALAIADAEAAWGELPADTVVAVETMTRASVAIQTASELVELDRLVAVVGHSNSAASLASAPIYNEHEVVQLSPQSSATAYSDAGRYSFRLVPPDDAQGHFLAEALRSMPGVERIVVLYVNDDYGRGLRTSLLDALAGGTPAVVGEVPHLEAASVRPDDVDLARRVVEETRPDAVVWLGRPLILSQHLPEFGSIPIIGSDALALAERSGSSSMWRTVSYVDFIDVEGSPELIEFGRRFEERFGRPVTSTDALTYDAMRMLLEATRQGARTGSEVRDWLNSLGRTRSPYEGLTGPITFEPDGDVARTYVLRRLGAHAPEVQP